MPDGPDPSQGLLGDRLVVAGGGGWYGGGNGGLSTTSTAGGGGAGSSWWYPGATNTSMATDTTGKPLVTISYTTPVTVLVSGS